MYLRKNKRKKGERSWMNRRDIRRKGEEEKEEGGKRRFWITPRKLPKGGCAQH